MPRQTRGEPTNGGSPTWRQRRRAKRLLRAFDRAVRRTQDVLDDRYGGPLACTLVEEARKEYERLIPELPDLRGRQPYTQFVVSTGWFLAFYRTLARHGRPKREAGEFAWSLTARYVEAVPGFVALLLHRVWFSVIFQRRARRKAARSQQRRGRGDFVFEYVERDAAHFDFGIDYVECAVWSFLQAQGAPELAPYICALDQIYSEAFGWGLVRTTTLAEGGGRCDFRFRRGGKSEIASTVFPPQVGSAR